MVTLNRAIATAQVHGPRAGLDLLDSLEEDKRLAGHHRLDAVRAHLLELAGDAEAARARRTFARPAARSACPSSATSRARPPACVNPVRPPRFRRADSLAA